MAAVVPARTHLWGWKLAAAALVLATLWVPHSAGAQTPTLEAAYVVLGPQGPVARAVDGDVRTTARLREHRAGERLS